MNPPLNTLIFVKLSDGRYNSARIFEYGEWYDMDNNIYDGDAEIIEWCHFNDIKMNVIGDNDGD